VSDRRQVPLRDAVVGGRTVVSKVVAILMTYLYGESKTFTEIVESTGLPLSTVHRLLWELTACRILERTEHGSYRVASTVRRIGAARHPVGLESRAALVLHDLAQTLDTEVRFGVLRTHQVAYIEKGRGRQPVTTFGDGATVSAPDTAMGLVLLAFSPRSVVDAALLRACTAAEDDAAAGPGRLAEVLHAASRASCRCPRRDAISSCLADNGPRHRRAPRRQHRPRLLPLEAQVTPGPAESNR
jgi:DNA-binding IclR family transcriptional regulator